MIGFVTMPAALRVEAAGIVGRWMGEAALFLTLPFLATQQGAHFRLAEPAVATRCPDRGDPAGRRPPRDRFRIDAEKRGYFTGCQEPFVPAAPQYIAGVVSSHGNSQFQELVRCEL